MGAGPEGEREEEGDGEVEGHWEALLLVLTSRTEGVKGGESVGDELAHQREERV